MSNDNHLDNSMESEVSFEESMMQRNHELEMAKLKYDHKMKKEEDKTVYYMGYYRLKRGYKIDILKTELDNKLKICKQETYKKIINVFENITFIGTVSYTLIRIFG